MLDEVGADATVMDSLAEAAESKIYVGKYESIPLLDNQSIEKTKSFDEGVVVSGSDLHPLRGRT